MAIKPPYTYVGGKRRLLKVIEENIPDSFGNFYEPFLGAGAVAIHVMENYPDRHYFLSDYNPHIPQTWLAIQHSIDDLIELLKEHSSRHSNHYFTSVRNWDRYGMFGQLNNTEVAARFIYICGASFGGGYSMNSAGYADNTPAIESGKPEFVVPEQNLRNLHALLNDRFVHIYRSDFALVMDNIKAGDFVYLDPPYVVDQKQDGYQGHDSYIKLDSTDEIVKSVYQYMDLVNTRGGYALGSNSDTNLTRELWDGWNKIEVKLKWTGGKNLGKDADTEVLWGNNALHRVLTSEPKLLPGEEQEKPKQRRKAPQKDQDKQGIPEPQSGPKDAPASQETLPTAN